MYYYNTDVEMVNDFLKLVSIIERKDIPIHIKKEASNLQEQLLQLLPVPKDNKTIRLHNLLNELYINNANNLEANMTLSNTDLSKNNNFIILFYRNSCPACKKIMPIWRNFKTQFTNSNFSILEIEDGNNNHEQMFNLFNVKYLPTIYKLKLNNGNTNKIEFDKEINMANLSKFASF